MKKYYINMLLKKQRDGGNKAKQDINSVLAKMGYKEIFSPKFTRECLRYLKIMDSLLTPFFFFTIKKDSVVVFQVPSYRKLLFDRIVLKAHSIRKFKLVTVIHDIEELRKIYINDESDIKNERHILENSDIIICHNKHMKDYLVERGIPACDIFTIDIFDYVLEKPVFGKETNKNIINVAGNLTSKRSNFIYELSKLNVNNIAIKLYGFGYEGKAESSSNVSYLGCFSPEEIPNQITKGWGLVWDGNSLESCEGAIGEYLKYINQHKVSLYLAAGIPVIIWERAGLADFVKENKVGICIKTLYELESTVNGITIEQYAELQKNVRRVAEQLQMGNYTKTVFEKVEKYLQVD